MKPLVLLTGATGYIGGRLLKRLESAGSRVRCLARRPDNLAPRVGEGSEVFGGDLLQPETLGAALAGVHTVFYLVHSMASDDFEETDRAAAKNLAGAAAGAGVSRIIYLGGLGDGGKTLSPHLRSRHEVGEILRTPPVQVIEFRASIVIGSGSLSFEMIRALVERLPVMITPRWVDALAQPIFIDDLLMYLMAALDWNEKGNRVFEIGGPEQVSYRDLMREYAHCRGLRRLMISVPVLSPRLSSLWLGLVTPVYARVGRKLIDSVRNATVVRDQDALKAFDIRPKCVQEAIAGALRNEDHDLALTHWSDSLSSAGTHRQWGGIRFGNRIVDSRVATVAVPPARAFALIRRIGGRTGWYYGDWLWTIRGWVDLIAGGAGMRRGRKDPEHLQVGDVVDCWRVTAYLPHRRLRLSAEMRLPGRAWLEFEVEGDSTKSVIRQTASYDPVGLMGLLYWYLLYPVHESVFSGMLRGIARRAAGNPPSQGSSPDEAA